MKVLLIVLAVLAVLGVVWSVFFRSGGRTSQQSYQEKYSLTDDPSSPVVIAVDPDVSDVEWAVNSDSDFFYSTVYEEDEHVPPEDRWFGIDHIVPGDSITLRCWPKAGGAVTSRIIFDESASLPARVVAAGSGQARLEH